MLITGASGFIGGRLLATLGADPGVEPRVLTRGGASCSIVFKGELLEPATLYQVCEGVLSVFHCAGYAHAHSASDPALHWRINYEGTRNLVAAAGAAGVRRFVFLSSVKAMPDPGDACADEGWPGVPSTPYGVAKRAAEEAVLEAGAKFGMHVVNLRLAMVYGRGGRGNLERMARGIRAGWFPPLPETGNRRSVVHVADAVVAMRLVIDTPAANGRTYIVADARPYSGRELYDAIRDALGKAPARWRVPAAVLRSAGRWGDRTQAVLGRSLPVNSEVADRLLGSAWYSPALIECELGWRAQFTLAEGIREMLAQGWPVENGLSRSGGRRGALR